MAIDAKNIEIVLAGEEHKDNIRSTLRDFYSDESVFKAQKIDVNKLNKKFYDVKKGDVTIVAIDKDNGMVASLAINSIIKPDNAIRQKEYAG